MSAENETDTSEQQSSSSQKVKLAALAGFLALAAIIAAIVVLTSSSDDDGPDVPELSQEQMAELAAPINSELEGLPQYGYVLGDITAPAKVLVFADISCTECTPLLDELVPALHDKVADKDVQVELQSLGNTKNGEMAAAIAIEQGNTGHLWNFVGLLFTIQNQTGSNRVSDDYLVQVAEASGGEDEEGGSHEGHNHDEEGGELDMLVQGSKHLAASHGLADTDLAVLVGPSDRDDFETISSNLAEFDINRILEAVDKQLKS